MKYKNLTKNEPLREVLTVNCVIVLVFLVGGSVSPEKVTELLQHRTCELLLTTMVTIMVTSYYYGYS